MSAPAPTATHAPAAPTPQDLVMAAALAPVPHVPPVTPPAMRFRITPLGRVLLYAAPLLLVGAVVAAGVSAFDLLPHGTATPYGGVETNYAALYNPLRSDDPPDGERLFLLNCARCHGPDGRGDGWQPVSPRARYIGGEGFKFTDTQNGLKQPQGGAGTLGGYPTDAALVALLRRGIPGSAMPAFAFTDDEAAAVVGHLRARFLTPARSIDRFRVLEKRRIEEGGEEFSEKGDWNEAKRARYRPAAFADVYDSTPLAVPTPFPASPPGGRERAAKMFTDLGCAGCHGADGRGTYNEKSKNDNGTVAVPRNFTAGLFKGGERDEDLFRRIYLGIPGTPMKAFGTELPPAEAEKQKLATREQIAELVRYVRGFVPAK